MRCPSQGVETRGGISGGEVVAQETAERTRRPYGVSSVHVCDDGSRVAVSINRTIHNYFEGLDYCIPLEMGQDIRQDSAGHPVL